MVSKAHLEAEHFLKNEKQFHLGLLPTEQSNPKTRDLDLKFTANASEGVAIMLSVDRDVCNMAQRILRGSEFQELVEYGVNAIWKGKKIVFSGCGATGRLSILLESMWRCFFKKLHNKFPLIYDETKRFEDKVFSIMTGGDYALIRSVEYFEDYHEFGKQQVREMDIKEGDILIAITEGGETSSVLGTVTEAVDRGAKVFLLFNNPKDILIKHIERSRRVIEDSRVTVLDLFCGPMAIAGSTRMQATTSEQLIAGAALEKILSQAFKQTVSPSHWESLKLGEIDYAKAFNDLLEDLLTAQNTETMGKFIKMEHKIYQENGLVTYFANEFLLDIFTDTTERSPTFMLPPFKKLDDEISPPSWAFVKNPLRPTIETWEYILGRLPRCIEWDSILLRQMGGADSLVSSPPKLDKNQIIKFLIGNEEDNSRMSRVPNIAVNIVVNRETQDSDYYEYKEAFKNYTTKFLHKSSLIIGNCMESADYTVLCSPIPSVLNLMDHLAVKLILNSISTGTMVLMGRVKGNWMSWVQISNKKLKDRGIRLIGEICGISYQDACYALHESIEELKAINVSGKEPESPVQYTIKKIKNAGKV